jgi:hypothetical protein
MAGEAAAMVGAAGGRRCWWRRPAALLAVAWGQRGLTSEWSADRRGKNSGKRRKGHGRRWEGACG